VLYARALSPLLRACRRVSAIPKRTSPDPARLFRESFFPCICQMALRSNACLLDPCLDKLLAFASDAADFRLANKISVLENAIRCSLCRRNRVSRLGQAADPPIAEQFSPAPTQSGLPFAGQARKQRGTQARQYRDVPGTWLRRIPGHATLVLGTEATFNASTGSPQLGRY
jgi:hypothetical protein